MGATVTIRDVPDDAHAELLRRADMHGQSLQEYLRRRMCALTSKPDMKTLMAQIEARLKRTGTNVPTATILADLDEIRR